MSDHVYKLVDVVGSSQDSVEDAIRRAVSKASQSVHNLEWFEVDSIRGHIRDGDVGHFQVTMKLGFRLDEWT